MLAYKISLRYEDNAFLRWSSICLGIDFSICHVKYFIDGRKVADKALSNSWLDLCAGKDPPWPNKTTMIKSGQNMVGYLTNLNMYKNMLNDTEMKQVSNLSCCFLPNLKF